MEKILIIPKFCDVIKGKSLQTSSRFSWGPQIYTINDFLHWARFCFLTTVKSALIEIQPNAATVIESVKSVTKILYFSVVMLRVNTYTLKPFFADVSHEGKARFKSRLCKQMEP